MMSFVTPYMLADAAVVVILLFFGLRGKKRGLILTLCSLVGVIVAFIGAGLVADAFAPRVAQIIEPKISQLIEDRLEKALTGEKSETAGAVSGKASAELGEEEKIQLSKFSVDDVLNSLKKSGRFQSLLDKVAEVIENGKKDAAKSGAATVSAGVAETVAHALVFVLSFVVILLLWTLLSHALDLVAKLPVLHFFNKTGGFVLGTAKGVLVLFVVLRAAQYLGGFIPEDMAQNTVLLKWFLTADPFAFFP